jgi:hypothetical protein
MTIMGLKAVSRRLWEALKAWKRGEKRRKDVPKSVNRGRIYEKRAGTDGSGIKIGAKPKLKIRMKITRAKDGSVEEYNV